MKAFRLSFGIVASTLITAAILLLLSPSFGQEADTSELAKKTQNPVSDLISLPFQNNTNFKFGPKEKPQNVLNIQPVIPLPLSEEWNLITRTIAPLIYLPETVPGVDSVFSLGDINATAFFSPAKPKKVVWGAGPILVLPTATNERTGTGKWSLGVSGVALTMPTPWVIGALVNNVWSFAGDSSRSDVNQLLFQYFINYNLPGGWYITSAPIITANWEADSSNTWTVPFGGGVGNVFHVGKQPMNASMQAFYNVETPEFGPDWTLRIQLQFLFPK